MTEVRLLLLALAAAQGAAAAEPPPAAAPRAADYATCAAFYFNAVNVKPMGEYEALYGAGERAFNEGLKLVGRKALDDLVAAASAEMMKLSNSNWKNFATVEQRYGGDCQRLLEHTPVDAVE
ncbi:MAG: hypothetical protein AB7I01_22250 [Gammaproteobacteria bacterium]